MKKLTGARFPMVQMVAVAAIALLVSGCTYTKADLLKGTITRISVLQKTEIPEVSATTTNGVLCSMKGYANDGGSAAVGVIVEKAVSAAVKAATP